MQLRRGSCAGRSNRSDHEGEAEGAAPQFPAEECVQECKSATDDHAIKAVATMSKGRWQPCQNGVAAMPNRGDNHAKTEMATMADVSVFAAF
jgi:hypothetical protein